ncbi:MAG: hypothetical protein JXR37_07400 [Kiritimatiellae bacterium]|nr:hypothetical protein [Kiritimatiellia bacterium]
MTSKERVLATIARQPTDRIPVYHIQFSGQVAAAILGRAAYVGGAHLQWREIEALWNGADAHAEFEARCEADAVAIAGACDHDILRLQYWRWPVAQKPTRKIDDYTFVFGDPDGAHYTLAYDPALELFSKRNGTGSAVPRTAQELDTITEETYAQEVLAEEAAARAYAPDAAPPAGMAAAYGKYPAYLVRAGSGTANIRAEAARELMAVALWPELVARRLTARAERIAKDVPGLAAAGMQVNFSGSDFCSEKGPMISPETFRDVVMPALRLIVDACHRHGIAYFYSTDGNLWPVADAMFNGAGVDGYYEVDRRAGMDLRRLRERFPRVTLLGNISAHTLHRGTEADVIREVTDCMEVAHELGGVIVGVSNMIMPGTPPANIGALLKTIAANR